MAAETEIERLVVSFVGDVSGMTQATDPAVAAVKKVDKASIDLEDTMKRLQGAMRREDGQSMEDAFRKIENAMKKSGVEGVQKKFNTLRNKLRETEEQAKKTAFGFMQLGNTLSILPGPAGRVGASISNATSALSSFGAAGPYVAAAAGAIAIAISAVAVPFITLSKAISVSIAKFGELDPVIKRATALGESVGNLQSLAFAFEEIAGIGIDKTAVMLKRLQIAIGQASITGGDAAKTLEQLGIDVQALAQMTPTEQFTVLAKALEGVTLQSERAAIAVKLFGEEGTAMLPILEAGSEAIQEAEEFARKYGLTLDDIGSAGIESANDAVGRLRKVFEGLINQLSATMAPVIEAIAEMLVDMLPSASELKLVFFAVQEIAIQLLGIIGDIGNVIIGIAQIAMGKFSEGLANIKEGFNRDFTKYLREEVDLRIQANKEAAEANKEAEAATSLQSEATESAAAYVDQLKQQAEYADYVAAGGKASADVFKMMQQGVDQGLIDAAIEFEQRIAEVDAKMKRRASGEALNEQYADPIEKAKKEAQELMDMLLAGDITQTTFDRAIEDINKGLNEADEKTKELKDQFAPLRNEYIQGVEGFMSQTAAMRAQGMQAATGIGIEQARVMVQGERRGEETDKDKKLINVLEMIANRLGGSGDPNAMTLEQSRSAQRLQPAGI